MVVKPGSIDATNDEITYTICNCAMNPFYVHRQFWNLKWDIPK